MSKKNTMIALGSFALFLGVYGILASQASAYMMNPSVNGPNYSVERHTAMEKAFETNDYTAWKNLMEGRGRVLEVITQDNFAKFAEAHNLAEKGDFVGAQKIRQDLGLGMRNSFNEDRKGSSYKGMNRGGMHRGGMNR
ncbi:MAG: hypothetical protein K9L98_01115 [Candidatus Pacebacteria bacterium]|nr:hypothetical protein [Candidatus Paceibacterota bacterium]MCF7862591.1 hypothetical protein [Candidatus Paceibacterota bacterium]